MAGGGWIGVPCDYCGETVRARSESSDAEPLERIALVFSLHMVTLHPARATVAQRELVRAHESTAAGPDRGPS